MPALPVEHLRSRPVDRAILLARRTAPCKSPSRLTDEGVNVSSSNGARAGPPSRSLKSGVDGGRRRPEDNEFCVMMPAPD
jgi:hypothetical protein